MHERKATSFLSRTALALLVVAISAPAPGQMYKWTDKDGKVHYTDKPPPADARQQRAPARPPARPVAPEHVKGVSGQRCADVNNEMARDGREMVELQAESRAAAAKKDVRRYCMLQRQGAEIESRMRARMKSNLGSCGLTQAELSKMEEAQRVSSIEMEARCEGKN